MLTLREKIVYLENCLNKTEENYADSFRIDIRIFFDQFDIENKLFDFLNAIKTLIEIEKWISKLTSRIVMKEDELEVNEIINDFLELG
jgi:hypothetical protein